MSVGQGKAVEQIPPLDYRIGLLHWITALDYCWFASFEMATKQVHPMDFTGNISENWARWKELMELVLAGPSANKWTETQKAAQFLICIDQQGRDMARAWVSSGELSEDDKKSTSSANVVCHLRNTLRAKKECDHSKKAFLRKEAIIWIDD